MAVYASSVIDAEDLTRRLPKMGAVKTSRHSKIIAIGEFNILKGTLRDLQKLCKRLRNEMARHYKTTNNRRKMAGLPLMRRAKS